jgi:hypothetical protein
VGEKGLVIFERDEALAGAAWATAARFLAAQ